LLHNSMLCEICKKLKVTQKKVSVKKVKKQSQSLLMQ